MTDGVKTKKARTVQEFAKISLNKDAADKVSHWLDQANASLFGAKLNRSLLTSWYVLQAPQELSSVQIEKLKTDFQSEVGFAQWLGREIARRHALGDIVSVQDLIKEKLSDSYQAPKTHRKRREKKLALSISELDEESNAKTEEVVSDLATQAISSASNGEF